jgi:hypothetical protein
MFYKNLETFFVFGILYYKSIKYKLVLIKKSKKLNLKNGS